MIHLIFHPNLVFSHVHKHCITHHYRRHQMLWTTHTDAFYWLSPCTPTDYARFDSTYSTTACRCCEGEEEQTVSIVSARHTVAWSTLWRPSFCPSSCHTPSPSCRYGGLPLYQSSGPDLQSVWLLSSLHRDTGEVQTVKLEENQQRIFCYRWCGLVRKANI